MVVPLVLAIMVIAGLMAGNAAMDSGVTVADVAHFITPKIDRATQKAQTQDARCDTAQEFISNPLKCYDRFRGAVESIDSSDLPFDNVNIKCEHLFARIDKGDRTQLRIFEKGDGPTCKCFHPLNYYTGFDYSTIKTEDEAVSFFETGFACEPEVAKVGLIEWGKAHATLLGNSVEKLWTSA